MDILCSECFGIKVDNFKVSGLNHPFCVCKEKLKENKMRVIEKVKIVIDENDHPHNNKKVIAITEDGEELQFSYCQIANWECNSNKALDELTLKFIHPDNGLIETIRDKKKNKENPHNRSILLEEVCKELELDYEYIKKCFKDILKGEDK